MKFDTEFDLRINVENLGYEGSKLSPQDWVDMLEEDSEFAEDFKIIFNNSDITEENDFTPEVLE